MSAWAFRGRGFGPLPGEDESEFVERVESCLRVAPTGAGSLRWSLFSGPRPEACLDTLTPTLTAWLESAFLGAYPPQSWSACPTPAGDFLPARSGWASPDALGPFRSSADGGRPWIELLLGQLRALPAGLQAVFELAPVGWLADARRPAWRGELAEQPPGFRLATPPLPVRSTSDRLEERRHAALWTLRVHIAVGSGLDPGDSAVDRMAEIVSGASKRDGGSRLRFRRWRPWPGGGPALILLSASEVATLFPLPDCRFRSGTGPPDSGAQPLVVGTGPGGTPNRLWVEPSQGRHLLVLGETGMGKSTLLVRLVSQAARWGGVLFFDPIGDTGRRVLAALPAGRRAHALWISPTRSPVGINALAPHANPPLPDVVYADRAIENLVLALRRVRSQRYGETPFWGPRIEETARRALGVAASLAGGTIVDAERLLAEPARRPKGIPPASQGAFDALRERALERPEEVDGARRLLGEVSSSSVLRRMLCAPAPRSHVAQWIGPGRITVITGEAAEIGESSARYLLALQLALVWSELLTRAIPTKVFLALDEAQWYAHETVAEILRLGRRANVHLWLSTQALASLPDPVAEAARTNAADLVQFRGSPAEAHELHRWIPAVPQESVMALARGEALVLRGKGESVEWATTPPASPRLPAEAELQAVADAARPLWSLDLDDPPRDGAEAGPNADPPDDPDARRLWGALRAGAEVRPSGSVLEVGLPDLRARFDPTGERLRQWGSRLARWGVLEASRDGPRGRSWRLRVDALRVMLPSPETPEEVAQASDDWRTLERSGGPSV